MHEPVTKRRPMIDMEEFERRLCRRSSGNQTEDDPLAELARPLGGQQASFQMVADPQGQRSMEARQDIWESGERQRPDAIKHFIGGDFASVEAGALDARGQGAITDLSGAGEPQAQEPCALLSLDGGTMACQDFATINEKIRSRRPLYVMAAIIIVGMAGMGASFGFRSGASSPPDSGSAKPQLEETNRSDVPTPAASIFGQAPQPSAGAVANNADQPADPFQAGETMQAIVAEDGSAKVRADSGLATEVARIAASPEQIETQGRPSSRSAPIEPKKMNTASLGRHDALLPSDGLRIVPLPVPRPAGVAKASTPKTAVRVATPRGQSLPIANTAKPKRPATVTAQPMQATAQGRSREPDALGDLLRGLFGNVTAP
jgi:hypothetical protein